MVDGAAIQRRVDETDLPLSTALGVMGINGVTAHYGLLELGRPQPGETVAVSTAAVFSGWDGVDRGAIPPGETLSYAQLAAKVGRPDAVRQRTVELEERHGARFHLVTAARS